jgi:hypothetical protein
MMPIGQAHRARLQVAVLLTWCFAGGLHCPIIVDITNAGIDDPSVAEIIMCLDDGSTRE